MPTYDDLAGAVARRRAVLLEYVKDGGGARKCHPHVIFESSTGKLLLEAYQVSGYSSSGSVPGWRQFDLRHVESLTILDESFELAPGYNPGNRSRYVRIHHAC